MRTSTRDVPATFQVFAISSHGTSNLMFPVQANGSRDKKPNWSRYYSGSGEIHQYLEGLSDKYNLRRYVKFEHEITKAEWLSEEGLWEVTIRHGNETFKDRAEFLINGGGVLK